MLKLQACKTPRRLSVQRVRLIFFAEGCAAFFFAGATFRRGAVFFADFFTAFARFAGFFVFIADFIAGLADAARDLIGALLRAARVFSASSAFSSASNSAGVRGRADLRRRSMS